MKISFSTGFLISLLIVIALGLALLFTTIWYTVILSGLVASLLIRKGYLVSALSSFLGGVVVIVIVFIMLPLGHIGALMGEVGQIAGISSILLISMIFLINGGLSLSGALIGTFVTGVVKKG